MRRYTKKTCIRSSVLERLENRHLLTKIVDIDSDGDRDILDGKNWYENVDGNGSFQEHEFANFSGLDLADIDNDGDVDILANNGKWFENIDGDWDAAIEHIIAPGLSDLEGKFDIGNDGDIDFIFNLNNDLQIYENDGNGVFSAGSVLTDTPSVRFQHVYGERIADIQQDGLPELVSLNKIPSPNDDAEWFEVRTQEFGSEEQVVAKKIETVFEPIFRELATRPFEATFAEINGDGAADLIVTWDLMFGGQDVLWYPNDGTGVFGEGQNITTLDQSIGGQTFAFVDFDEDGDDDFFTISFVTPSPTQYVTCWSTNVDGRQKRGDCVSAQAAGIGLLTDDLVPDFLTSNTLGRVLIDGQTYTRTQLNSVSSIQKIDTLQRVLRTWDFDSVHSELDFDTNGWLDHRDVSHLLTELLMIPFGDSNLDGKFDSSDLVSVFQAGEYEDALPLNSTWSDGDWNGDGEFDSADLVFVFQQGDYDDGTRRLNL